jgi:tetratricopeptide (TPR) repeat protein
LAIGPSSAEEASATEEAAGMLQVALGVHRRGDARNAAIIYEEVLRRDPRNPDALHLLGLALHQQGQSQRAVELIGEALQARPGDAVMLVNRALALSAVGRAPAALEDLDRALSIKPDIAQAHYGRATALQGLGRLEEAVAAFDRTIALWPKHASAYIDRGNALKDLGRHDAAVASYEAALALEPGNPTIWYNRGAALRALGRVGEAIESYGHALAARPDFAVAHHNRAVCRLLAGDYPGGFEEYEWRRKCPDFAENRAFPGPEWTGAEALQGKTLFIYPELYLGDVIQFSRYARMAEARGARVILAAPPVLHRLLRTLSPTIRLAAPDDAPPAYDLSCAMMSLPLAFGARRDNVPAQVPYLSAEPERIARWKARIGTAGLRIGVCWQGSTLPYAAAMQRSFPLAALAGVAGAPGVRLISLQKHDGLDQLGGLPPGMAVETLGEDFDAGPDAFLDTAAAIAACDLVISADTAVAHLAGALGAPTWVPLPFAPDWRWGTEGADSPWYPTVRLFRQAAPGDWAGVFGDIEAALKGGFHA